MMTFLLNSGLTLSNRLSLAMRSTKLATSLSLGARPLRVMCMTDASWAVGGGLARSTWVRVMVRGISLPMAARTWALVIGAVNCC